MKGNSANYKERKEAWKRKIHQEWIKVKLGMRKMKVCNQVDNKKSAKVFFKSRRDRD